MASPPASPPQSLSFTSLNPNNPTTILLLHGGFVSRAEFAKVTPHLSSFHLLLPDLPLHSASRHISPGTTKSSAHHVAQLIRSHAHGGTAHIVGVSMGGYIGQYLALENPDLVLSLFVSGAAPITGKRLYMAQATRTTYYSMKLMLHWLPDWVYRYQVQSMGLELSDELIEAMRENTTWELVQDMFPWILTFTLEHVQRLKVRTLHVAGAKGDDVAMTERTGEALRKRETDEDEAWPEDGSGATVIREGTHGWDMQFPELFAQGVAAWVNSERLPEEYERL